MERTRLCIITDAWLPQVNGVVTTLTNLVEQATNDGWDVLVVHPGFFFNMKVPHYPEVRLCWPKGMKKMVREFNPDHLHIATEGPLGFAARVSFRKLTYTTAYHTSWPEFLKDQGPHEPLPSVPAALCVSIPLNPGGGSEAFEHRN